MVARFWPNDAPHARRSSPTLTLPVFTGISHTYHGPREAARVNLLDAACTLGLWTLNTLSVVASFEATKWVASLSPYNDGFGIRYVVLSMVALVAWAFSTSVLLAVFKRAFASDFDRPPAAGVRVLTKR